MRVQVIGVCRFSVLTTGGFKSGPQDLDERAAFLFNDQRLARRMAWFRNVVLPSIRAQSDRDFTLVVLASTRLPPRWRGELSDAVAGQDGIDLDFVEPGRHFEIGNTAISSRVAPGTEVVAQFRLDDDDAVARDYVARVRTDFDEILLPLFLRSRAVCCDYSHGFVLQADGQMVRLYRTKVATWTPGQTVYLPPDSENGLFSWGHHRLHGVMPTVTLGDSNMFLRGLHDANDSSFAVPRMDTQEWGLDALPRRFDINPDALMTALRAAG